MAINTDVESDFARAVYQLVGSIPQGRIASYGQIATLAGFPKHARFVGKLMSNLPKDTRLRGGVFYAVMARSRYLTAQVKSNANG